MLSDTLRTLQSNMHSEYNSPTSNQDNNEYYKQQDSTIATTLVEDSSWTPLMRAAISGDTEAVTQYLFDKNKTNNDKGAALILAAKEGYESIVELLDPTTDKGVTALMRAADRGDIDTVQSLIHIQKKRQAPEEVRLGSCVMRSRTALMGAAAYGYAEIVALLLEHEATIGDTVGRTALMLAAANGHVSCVELLVEKEGGMQMDSGLTALMWAAVENRADCIPLLLGKEARMRDDKGCTALIYAAKSGSVDVIGLLLEHENGIKDEQDRNALYHAIKTKHLQVAKLIVGYEDPTDQNGITALMRAVAKGDIERVKLLAPIQKGMRDRDGNIAFVYALTKKRDDIAMILREHEASSWTQLMRAAASGDIDATRKHISEKDKINNDGDTALILAARAGYRDIIDLLDPTDGDGITALMRAADRNDVETVRALIPLQRKMRMTRSITADKAMSSMTALMRAAAYGNTEVVELLVDHEGGMQASRGQTALMGAANNDRFSCVKILLEKEGGMQENNGFTAMMFAAHGNKFECVKILLEKEAGIQNKDGWTALMWAADNRSSKCVQILLDKETGMSDKNGWTALMLAAHRNDIDSVKLLVDKEKDMNTTCQHCGFPPGTTALDVAKECSNDDYCRREYGDYTEIISMLSK